MTPPARQRELIYTYLTRGQTRVAALITARRAPAEALEASPALLDNRAATLGILFYRGEPRRNYRKRTQWTRRSPRAPTGR